MYKGLIPPLVTPLDNDGKVCEDCVRKLIEFVTPFSAALLPLLTSGEGWKVSKRQWSDMLDFTLKHAKGLDVLVGVEMPGTDEVIEFGLLAKKKGASAIVATTPFTPNITQKRILAHFEAIASKVKMPLMVYNEKGISGNDIELDTIQKICALDNVIGVKEASGNAEYTNSLIQILNVPVFQGWEDLASVTHDPAGYIFPLANLEPELCTNMFENPTLERQEEINTQCLRYGILDSAPHINLKKYLYKNNIICNALTV